MKRLNLETWKNIFRNLADEGEEVEVMWLDGFQQDDGTVDLTRGEWCLCFDCELFEDGFSFESEAQSRLEYLESTLL